jgi:predicted PurR-regulated permease PerM
MFFIPETVRKNPWVQTFVVLLVLTLFVSFTVWIRDILLPFFLAFIIAYMLDPLVDQFELQLGLGRTVSVVLLLIIITIISVGFFYYLADQAIEFAGELGDIANNPPDVRSWIDSVVPEAYQQYFEGYVHNLKPQELVERAIQFVRDHMSGIVDTLTQGSTYLWLVATRTFGVVGFLINVTVVVIVSIYLLRDFDYIVRKTRTLVPHRYREEVDDIVSEIDELMRAFFRGHLIVCFTTGILYGTGYQLVGLEGGFLVGVISGAMNVIPYLGPAIGFTAAIIMAVYQFGMSPWILAVAAVYVAVQSLEGNVLTPYIVGEAVGLSPVVVIFALMVFGKILGFLGLLLAIPLAAIVKVLLKRIIARYRESNLYQAQS